jgi:hypothetical protein
MPIRYSVDRLHGRLLTHADGILTFHDINARMALMYSLLAAPPAPGGDRRC